MSTIAWRVVPFSVTPPSATLCAARCANGPPAVADVDEARIGERAIAAFGRAVLAVEADHLTRRVGAGERPDHQAVDDAEDAGVDADAERQHADGGEREARMLREKAQTVAKVLPECPHHCSRRSVRELPQTAAKGRLFQRRASSSYDAHLEWIRSAGAPFFSWPFCSLPRCVLAHSAGRRGRLRFPSTNLCACRSASLAEPTLMRVWPRSTSMR